MKAANLRPLEQSLPHLDGGSYKYCLVERGCLGLILEFHLAQVAVAPVFRKQFLLLHP